MPVLISLLLLPLKKYKRVTGVDSMINICGLCEEMGKSVFLVGANEKENRGAARFLRAKFKTLQVRGVANGGAETIARIKPDVLFVAYGAPKQTVWIERFKDSWPSARVAIGVGGALAVLSGRKSRAPGFMRNSFEWLWRLLHEPKRFFRIWRAVVMFPYLIWQQKRGTFTHTEIDEVSQDI